MALNNMGLGFQFTAKDLASGTIRGLEGNMNKLGDTADRNSARMQRSFKAAAAGAALIGGAAVMGAGVAALSKHAEGFEYEMAKVGAILSTNTGEMNRLEAAALKAGLETQFSPKEAASALKELGAILGNTNDTLDMLQPSLDLAAASLGQLGLADAAVVASAATALFAESNLSATEVTDKLVKAANSMNLQFNDMQAVMSNLSRVAGEVGPNMDETLIAIGLMRNVSIPATVAGTAVSSAIGFMAKSAKDGKIKVGDMAIALEDSKGKMLPLVDIVMQLEKATEKMSDTERKAALTKAMGRFGVTAYGGVLSGLNKGIKTNTGETLKGAKAYEYYKAKMKDSSGASEEFRKRMLDTLTGQKTLLKGSIETFAIALGKPIAQAFKPMVTVVLDGFNKILMAFTKLPDKQKKFIAGLLVGIPVVMAITGAFLLLYAAAPMILPVLAAIKTSLLGLATGILPFVFWIGIAVAAFYLLKKAYDANLGGIAEAVNSMVAKVKLAFSALWELASMGGIGKDTAKSLQEAGNGGVFAFVQSITRGLAQVRSVFKGVFEGLKGSFGVMRAPFESLMESFALIKKAVMDVFNTFKPAASNTHDMFWSGVKVGQFLATVFGYLATVIAFAVRVVATLFNWTMKLWTGVAQGLKASGVFDAVAGTVKMLIGYLKMAVDWVMELFDFGSNGGNNFSIFLQAMGQVIGVVLGGAIRVVLWLFRGIVHTVAGIVRGIIWLGEILVSAVVGTVKGIIWYFKTWYAVMKAVASGIVSFFKDPFDVIFNLASKVFGAIRKMVGKIIDVTILDAMKDKFVSFIGGLLAKIPARFRSAGMDKMVVAGEQADVRIADRKARKESPTTPTVTGTATQGPGTVTAVAAVGNASGAASSDVAEMSSAMKVSAEQLAAMKDARRTINIKMNDQILATTMEKLMEAQQDVELG